MIDVKPYRLNAELKNLLLQKKSSILRRWCDLIIETYPAETSQFFKEQKNRFSNPIGYTISQGTEGIFNELLQGIDSEKISPFLDTIIRVRAIQDFTPSQALSFIFLLKRVVREELEREIREKRISDELLPLECRIDDLALLAFDIYMKCREKIYEIKADEVRRRTFRLLQRAQLVSEEQDAEEQNSENTK